MDADCPFCDLPPDRILMRDDVGVAFLDSYPVTEGHTLVVPLRHVASVFDLSGSELQALFGLVSEVRTRLAALYRVEHFNIGINDGASAGQTINHAHVHVIPRRPGDVPDPRGGVRWVMPTKARYWTD